MGDEERRERLATVSLLLRTEDWPPAKKDLPGLEKLRYALAGLDEDAVLNEVRARAAQGCYTALSLDHYLQKHGIRV